MQIIYDKVLALKEIQDCPQKAKREFIKTSILISLGGIIFAGMWLFLCIISDFIFHDGETAIVSVLMLVCIFVLCCLLIHWSKNRPEDYYSSSTEYYSITFNKKILDTTLVEKSKGSWNLKITVSDNDNIVTSHFIYGLTPKHKTGIDDFIVDLEKGMVFIPYKQ